MVCSSSFRFLFLFPGIIHLCPAMAENLHRIREPFRCGAEGNCGAFENFIEDDERVAVLFAISDKLLQSKQLGVEVTDAVSKVIGGAHTAEQRET